MGPRSVGSRDARGVRGDPPSGREPREGFVSLDAATGDAERREGAVTVGGLRFHYFEWGSADVPTLILLHGGGSSARGTWSRTAPRFASRYHVFAFDMRGHGESEWDPEARYTLGVYARDVEGLIEKLGLAPVHVVGHSMGGFIGLVLAAWNPEKVRHLVLVDIAPRPPMPQGTRRMTVLDRRPLRFGSRAEAEDYLHTEQPTATARRGIGYGLIEQPDGTVTWRTDVAGLVRANAVHEPLDVEGLWPELAALQCPILAIRGGRSRTVETVNFERMQRTNARVRLMEYSDAGHWLHNDEPERFASDIVAFLEEGASLDTPAGRV